MLHCDIFYRIFTIALMKQIFTKYDVKNLKLVNRLFYIICKKLRKLQAQCVVAKYLQNCKNKLLYQKNTMNEAFLCSISKYEKWDPFICGHDISLYTTPSFLLKLELDKRGSFFSTDIPRSGEIITSFIIVGRNIKMVELYNEGHMHPSAKPFFRQHFINAGIVNVMPFKFGFYIINNFYSMQFLRIYADELQFVYARYLVLDSKQRRFVALNKFILENDFYCNKEYFSHIRVGMFGNHPSNDKILNDEENVKDAHDLFTVGNKKIKLVENDK